MTNPLADDPRLTAFITHGGQGSITEASEAGESDRICDQLAP